MSEEKYSIGNWVKCKISNDAAWYQVVSIEKYGYVIGLSGAREGEKIPIGKIKPIPLTANILDALGFKYKTLGDNAPYEMWILNGLEIWDFNGKHWVVDMADQTGFTMEHFKYVHQLQNIYYLLDNKELDLKALKTPSNGK